MTDTQQPVKEAGISILPENIIKIEEPTGCTLVQYAAAKRLPIDFLKSLGLKDMKYWDKPAVRIPYRNAQGKEIVVRFRIALEGEDRFRWKKGSKLSLYVYPASIPPGTNAVLVEGESDCHTLWYHDMCAYGVPGANNWKEDYATILEPHDLIYVVIEPGTSGEAMLKWLESSSIRHKAKLVMLYQITGFKDPSDLYIADPENFKEKWLQALAAAIPYSEYEAVAKEIMPSSKVDSGDEIILPPQFSEDALAQRFTQRHKGELQYVAAWGRWFRWTGVCWTEDDTREVFDLARLICREASAEALMVLPDTPGRMRLANKIAGAQTVASVLKLAGADRAHAATVAQWDVDLYLLNTPNGVIDLRTGIMHEHNADYYMTKMTSVSPGGECPIWLQFLQKITAGNEELISYLKRKAGYCLTGDTKEQDIDFFYGTGGNGKGFFLNTLTGIMSSYAAIANIDTFTASISDRHPTDLAMLRGARLVTAQETEEGRRWAESRIKALTGGDPITARFMRQDFFTYIPQFKLMIAGNHRPSLRNVDEAIRRRFHLVPFTVTISEKEKDKDLPEKLKSEWPGILKWAIAGAKEWHEKGLNPPPVVRDATAAYLSDEDSQELWIAECCVQGKVYTSTISDLYASWKGWCEAAGEHYGSMKSFSQNLRSKRTELMEWQCPVTRRRGLKGIQVIKSNVTHWSDTP